MQDVHGKAALGNPDAATATPAQVRAVVMQNVPPTRSRVPSLRVCEETALVLNSLGSNSGSQREEGKVAARGRAGDVMSMEQLNLSVHVGLTFRVSLQAGGIHRVSGRRARGPRVSMRGISS